MIDARELRIGDYFMAGKNPAVVLEIMASGVSFDSINGDICASHCDWDYVYSIPLTEQWLIDFGFEPSYFESGNIAFWMLNGSDILNKDMELRWFNTKVDYVHTLQNLIFDLKGKELTKK